MYVFYIQLNVLIWAYSDDKQWSLDIGQKILLFTSSLWKGRQGNMGERSTDVRKL